LSLRWPPKNRSLHGRFIFCRWGEDRPP